jgi:hypothetical protein
LFDCLGHFWTETPFFTGPDQEGEREYIIHVGCERDTNRFGRNGQRTDDRLLDNIPVLHLLLLYHSLLIDLLHVNSIAWTSRTDPLLNYVIAQLSAAIATHCCIASTVFFLALLCPPSQTSQENSFHIIQIQNAGSRPMLHDFVRSIMTGGLW